MAGDKSLVEYKETVKDRITAPLENALLKLRPDSSLASVIDKAVNRLDDYSAKLHKFSGKPSVWDWLRKTDDYGVVLNGLKRGYTIGSDLSGEVVGKLVAAMAGMPFQEAIPAGSSYPIAKYGEFSLQDGEAMMRLWKQWVVPQKYQQMWNEIIREAKYTTFQDRVIDEIPTIVPRLFLRIAESRDMSPELEREKRAQAERIAKGSLAKSMNKTSPDDWMSFEGAKFKLLVHFLLPDKGKV